MAAIFKKTFRKRASYTLTVSSNGQKCRTKRYVRQGAEPQIISPAKEVSGLQGVDTVDIPVSSSTWNTRKNRTYAERRSALEAAWTEVRDRLQIAYIESVGPCTSTCCMCAKAELQMPVACADCGPTTVYCQECSDKIHEFVLYHKPKMWKSETFVDQPLKPVRLHRTGHQCNTEYDKHISAIDSRGRHHEVIICCCQCEPEACALVRFRLWPGSPTSPNVAFDFNLLELQRMLFVEAQVSVYAFCNALEHLNCSTLLRNRSGSIYKAMIAESANEYSFFNHRIVTLSGVNSCFDRGTTCPACPTVEHGGQIISMDANFGLVRKKSGGQSQNESKFKDLYFMNQDVVDTYMDELPEVKVKDADCSNFQAGDIIRSATKTSRLDETAVFGATCKHEMPKFFCNIKKGGERLGYAMCLLKHLREHSDCKSRMILMYDVACVLEKYVKNQEEEELLENVTLAIPVFHNYGHCMRCQVMYNPRRLASVGLADGECVERLWSYLRKFAPMTKLMSVGNRSDALTAALLHYASRVRTKMSVTLVRKMKIATDLSTGQLDQMKAIIEPLQLNDAVVPQWCEELLQVVKTTAPSKVDHSAAERYAYLLHTLSCASILKVSTDGDVRYRAALDFERIEQQLVSFEAENNTQRWNLTSSSYKTALAEWAHKERAQLLRLMWKRVAERRYMFQTLNRYADGQGVAKRIKSQVARITRNIRKDVQQYNSIGTTYGTSATLPASITVVEVLSDSWPVWQHIVSTTVGEDCSVPAVCKRLAVDAYQMHLRAEEEKVAVVAEMAGVCTFLRQQYDLTVETLEFYRQHDVTEAYFKGVVCLLLLKCFKLQAEMNECNKAFGNFVDCNIIDIDKIHASDVGVTSDESGSDVCDTSSDSFDAQSGENSSDCSESE